jgi:DNA repair protein RadC
MNWQTVHAQLPMVKETSDVKITTAHEVHSLCQDIATLAQECFQVITCNSKNMVINRHLISLGLLDASLVHPREVYRAAILDSAAFIVLVHNHPSGDPTPSAEDIRITRQLIQAGKLMDIKVMDHIIIGQPQHSSMRESGVCDFS